MGLSNVKTLPDEASGSWRMRAEGGPFVHIHYNSKVSLSWLKARNLRKALGPAGQRPACFFYPETDDAVILADENREWSSERLKEGEPK
jgi:hypothetical protein